MLANAAGADSIDCTTANYGSKRGCFSGTPGMSGHLPSLTCHWQLLLSGSCAPVAPAHPHSAASSAHCSCPARAARSDWSPQSPAARGEYGVVMGRQTIPRSNAVLQHGLPACIVEYHRPPKTRQCAVLHSALQQVCVSAQRCSRHGTLPVRPPKTKTVEPIAAAACPTRPHGASPLVASFFQR